MTMSTPGVSVKKKTTRNSAAGAVAAKASPDKKPPSLPRKRVSRQSATPLAIDSQKRHEMIQVAAFYVAQSRGFDGDRVLEDWLQAEQEIDAMLLQSSDG